ncbi:MAG: cytochrome c [Planctomycetota bacterium]|jgi:cytochrome c
MLSIVLAAFPCAVSPNFFAQEAPDPTRFEPVILHQGFDRPLELAVLPDGRVLVIELTGTVWLWRGPSASMVEAARIPVFTEQENGLLGMTLDPSFIENGWVYLLKSPPGFVGQELSRFTLIGDSLDLSSEVILFAFAEQREQCCHHAGSIEFGPNGELFIATGDNTHPHGDSGGYAPLDEREGREAWNAANTSGNPFSASGKVLRIRPHPDGSYGIPEGNLFPRDGSMGLPEIYVMGCRNPWRISVDAETGALYWGDVGPDAGADGPRGPMGYDEINRATGPGNFGWPFFISDNLAYSEYSYDERTTGPPYQVQRPVNASRLVQGPIELPPAVPAWISYPYGDSEKFPELNAPGGRTACAGPVYSFEPGLDSKVKFPAWFDRTLLIYEWSRHWLKVVRSDREGKIEAIEPLPVDFGFTRPVDMEFGPEGALYVLEYGETWGTNPDSKLVRIDYVSGNRSPRARVVAASLVGAAPFVAELTAAETVDPDGDVLSFSWSLLPPEGDASAARALGEGSVLTHTFEEPGIYAVELKAEDALGASSITGVALRVGNAPPRIEFLAPLDGSFIRDGEELSWHVQVVDAEDGDSEDPDDLEPAWWMREVFVQAIFEDSVGDAASFPEPAGLAAMRASDCLGCHAVERRIVGPSFREVAERYNEVPRALEEALERVRLGSSGVWGSTPMRAHPDLDPSSAADMVRWVLSLHSPPSDADEEPQSGAIQGVGVVGRFSAGEFNSPEHVSGVLLVEAIYSDTGGSAEGEPVGPLEARQRVILRTPLIEAEHATGLVKTRVLQSESASGREFLGAVDDGAQAQMGRMRLDRVRGFRVRVSSAGGGGLIRFHASGMESQARTLLAEVTVEPNGSWDEWFQLEAPLTEAGLSLANASGSVAQHVTVSFHNPRQPGGLMNLDTVEVLFRD